MEIIVFSMLMATILVKNGITDAKAYAAGRTPDRFARSQALIDLAGKTVDRSGKKQRPAKTKPRRARAYMSQCIDDAWNDAAKRRQIRHEAKAPAKAERYRRKIDDRVQRRERRHRDRELKRTHKRLDRELTKTEREQVRDRNNRRSGDIHDPITPYHRAAGADTSTTEGGALDGDTTQDVPESPNSPQDSPAADSGSSSDEATTAQAPEQAAGAEAEGEALPGAADEPAVGPGAGDAQGTGGDAGGRHGPASMDSGSACAAGATPTTSNGKGAAAMSEMTYEGGLANALAYCTSQATKRGEDVASVAETLTGLEAAKYGNEVLQPLSGAQEALETAVAAFEQAATVLESYVSVQEAYDAAPGAPDKDELLAHQ